MKETCHHCGKNESSMSLIVHPWERVYPVCERCFQAIEIGHEMPHVAGPLKWSELPTPTYSELNEPFEKNDLVELKRRYGTPPSQQSTEN
jgi:hypothetical protein